MLRATTFSCRNSLRLLISASDMPSDKYSVSILRVAFSKGNTTMLFSGVADVTADVLVFCRCHKRKQPKAMAMRINIATPLNTHFRVAGFRCAFAAERAVLNLSGTSG